MRRDAKAEMPWTQLSVRIPKDLHRRIRIHCTTRGSSLMQFIVEALEAKLGRKASSKRATA
jgi:predicted HicB family RNase H-like nuclease